MVTPLDPERLTDEQIENLWEDFIQNGPAVAALWSWDEVASLLAEVRRLRASSAAGAGEETGAASYEAFRSLGPISPEAARKIAVEWEMHPPYRDDVRWLSDSYRAALARAEAAESALAGAREALGRAVDLIRDMRPYAAEAWEWKYGEGWLSEEVEIAHTLAALSPAPPAARETDAAPTTSKDGE